MNQQKYLALVILQFLLRVDAEFQFDFQTDKFLFIDCHRAEDRRNVDGGERNHFEFTFNTSLPYSQFEISICEENNSTECNAHPIECEEKKQNGEVVCPLIKGLYYTPISAYKKTLRLKSVVFGKNKSGSYIVAESVSNYSLCLLRKCKKFGSPVGLHNLNLADERLDFMFDELPSQTNNYFNQYLVKVQLVSDVSKLTLLTKNLTNRKNIPEDLHSIPFTKCITNYTQICVAIIWDYCLDDDDNNSKMWQTVKECQSFSYSSFLPDLFVQCTNVEMGITVEVTSTVKFSSFDFVYTLKNGDIIKTPNSTVMINGNYRPATVAICDRCKCGKQFDIDCKDQPNTMFINPDDNTLVIILGVVGLFLVLILLTAVFLWKRICKKSEELPDNDIINPTPSYQETSIVQQIPHSYFDVVIQE